MPDNVYYSKHLPLDRRNNSKYNHLIAIRKLKLLHNCGQIKVQQPN